MEIKGYRGRCVGRPVCGFLRAAGGDLHEIRWTDGDRNRKGDGADGGSDGSSGRNPAFWRLYRGNQRGAGDGQERYDTGGQGSGKYGSDTFSAPRGREDGGPDDAGTDAGGRL